MSSTLHRIYNRRKGKYLNPIAQISTLSGLLLTCRRENYDLGVSRRKGNETDAWPNPNKPRPNELISAGCRCCRLVVVWPLGSKTVQRLKTNVTYHWNYKQNIITYKKHSYSAQRGIASTTQCIMGINNIAPKFVEVARGRPAKGNPAWWSRPYRHPFPAVLCKFVFYTPSGQWCHCRLPPLGAFVLILGEIKPFTPCNFP